MPSAETLQFAPRKRAGGGGATARDYLDFVVSGQSLRDRLSSAAGDLIGCLGWGEPDYQRAVVEQLLLQRAPELASGRHMLYVCPECGDIGCGSITAVVAREGGRIIWRDFGYENGYESIVREDLASVGPFYFEPDDYLAVISGAPLAATSTA